MIRSNHVESSAYGARPTNSSRLRQAHGTNIPSILSAILSDSCWQLSTAQCTFAHVKPPAVLADALAHQYRLDRQLGAELVDTTTDEQIWAEKYSGTMDDVFDVQERVSRAIVTGLRVTLTASEDDRLAERHIMNPLAFELYLRAQGLVRRYGASMDQVNALLDRASEIEGLSPPSSWRCSRAAQGEPRKPVPRWRRSRTCHFDGHITFHLSESFAVAGDIPTALPLLGQAVERGFYPHDHIAVHCPFLAPLRGIAEFDRIVATAAERVAAFRT